MTPLRMRRVRESLGNQAIAYCDVMRRRIAVAGSVDICRPRGGEILVDGPGCRAMIEDHVMHRPSLTAMGTKRVGGSFGAIARSYRDMLHDHIEGLDRHSTADDHDPRIRSGLPRD